MVRRGEATVKRKQGRTGQKTRQGGADVLGEGGYVWVVVLCFIVSKCVWYEPPSARGREVFA